MVFGLQRMQDDLFCITEERNYFQAKYTEQVSEIAALKEELRKARKEIDKLRGELMETSMSMSNGNLILGEDAYATPDKKPKSNSKPRSRRRAVAEEEAEEKKDSGEGLKEETASITEDEDEHAEQVEDGGEDEEEDKEAQDIRQSAEKLLQWAQYRCYASKTSPSASPDQRSLASSHHDISSLSPKGSVPSTIGLDAAGPNHTELLSALSQDSAAT